MASLFGGWNALWGAAPQPTATQQTLAPMGTLLLSHGAVSKHSPAKGMPVGKYAVGECVEYLSASQGTWIPARVVSLGLGGKETYNLDCKPDVTEDRLRPSTVAIEGAGANAEHKAGDIVEYLSSSQRCWIRAKVLQVNSTGTYNLDCKPDVALDRIRRPVAPEPVPLLDAPAPLPDRMVAGGQLVSTHSCANGTSSAPVQLLRVLREGKDWRYEVCPEGAAVLEQHGSRPIAVASLCGLYRTGKSFLLSLLTDRPQNEPLQSTEGLWLWKSEDDDDQSPLQVFVDCEGVGSGHRGSRDVQLLALCALLSSVMILNTKGALCETVFNDLSHACRFAEHLDAYSLQASRPSLLWVLRDFMLDLRDITGRTITPDEYLEQQLHARFLVGQDVAKNAQPAREARLNLLGFFNNRSCATLVQPVSDDSQLRNLERLPRASFRGEFKAGVEALRKQLVSTCHGHPKTIGGKPIGCFGFVGLLRQLVGSMNQGKILDIVGAWHAAQHSACTSLTEDLRETALEPLRNLGAGRQLPGGAQLPMTDEALRVVLRDRRRVLKSQWEDRAVGEEGVRKDYWLEFKETLLREEVVVRQQNHRLADERLLEQLQQWQEWLDDDSAAAEAGERLVQELGELYDCLPAEPLGRASRTAVEAAARWVAQSKGAVAAAAELSEESQRRCTVWGRNAAQSEGAARAELESQHAELLATQERIRRKQSDEQAAELELGVKAGELQDASRELNAALQNLQDAKAREAELQAQHSQRIELEAALSAEVEKARAASVRAAAEHHAAERGAQAAAEAAGAERRRLEEDVQAARAEVERLAEQLASERAVLKSEHEKTRSEQMQIVENAQRQLDLERSTLQGEQERARETHVRMLDEARAQLDEERRRHTDALEADQHRLLEKERTAGVMEGQVAALTLETSALRDQIAELQATLREKEAKAARRQQQNNQIREAAESTKKEHNRFMAELDDRSKAQKERFERQMEDLQERNHKKGCTPICRKGSKRTINGYSRSVSGSMGVGDIAKRKAALAGAKAAGAPREV